MNRALFLDRDGVINDDLGYVHRPEDVVFIQGIFELCRAAEDQGYLLIVITNQAGVAKGIYSEDEVLALHTWIQARFQEHGVGLDAFYYCPYHPEGTVETYRRSSFDRKPAPGMFLTARDQFCLDMPNCILVGDKVSDIEAAFAAGVGSRILLSQDSCDQGHATEVVSDLREATRLLFGRG